MYISIEETMAHKVIIIKCLKLEILRDFVPSWLNYTFQGSPKL